MFDSLYDAPPRGDRSAAASRSGKRRGESRASIENPQISLSDLDAWEQLYGEEKSDAGERVNADRMLTLAAFFQGVEMISGDLAKLPLAPYRPVDDARGKERDSAHAAFRLVHRRGRPNPETSAFELFRRMFAGALVYGNGYAWIQRADQFDPESPPVALFNLLPDRTAPFRRADGSLWYMTEVDGQLVPLRFDEVLHVRRFSLDNRTGVSLLEAARQAIGKGLAKEGFESRFFKNNATPGGILLIPAGTGEEAIKTLTEGTAKKYYSKENAFKTMVLRDGAKWEATQIDPEKSMLVELEDVHVRTAARFLNCPPSRLGATGSTSYNSREADRSDYLDSTLSPWLLALAGECGLKLLTLRESERGWFFEPEINALLWADSKSRSEIGNAGITVGKYTIDEVRAWDNLPPLPNGWGSRPLVSLNTRYAGDPAPNVPATTPAAKPAGDPPADPPVVQDDRSQGLALAWLRDAYGRARRRLENVCSRAKSADEWRAVAADLEAKHRGALVEIFAEAVAACRSIGLAHSADDLADQLLAAYRGGLEAGDRVTIDASLVDYESRFLCLESSAR